MRTIFVISTDAFSKNIRSLREKIGWSKEYFCSYFDMELWMLERIENGNWKEGFDIYYDSYLRILETTGMDSDYLIYGDQIPNAEDADYF